MQTQRFGIGGKMCGNRLHQSCAPWLGVQGGGYSSETRRSCLITCPACKLTTASIRAFVGVKRELAWKTLLSHPFLVLFLKQLCIGGELSVLELWQPFDNSKGHCDPISIGDETQRGT